MKQVLRLLTLFFMLILLNPLVGLAINYYSTGSNSSPTTLSNWKPNRDGTGLSPSNFTTAGNLFIVQDGHQVTLSTGITWTISGTGSKLSIEPGGEFTDNNGNLTATVLFAGSATKKATWNQVGPYTGITFDPASNDDTEFYLSISSATDFRNAFAIPGSLYISATTPTSLTLGNNLSVGGDLRVGSNLSFTFSGNTSRTVSIGGSLLIRNSSEVRLTSGTGITSLTIGGSISTDASSQLKTGPGTGLATINLGANTGTDTLNLSGVTLAANITLQANQTTLISSSFTCNTGLISVPAGTTVLNFGSAILTGDADLTTGAGATLVTANTAGFRDAGNTAGCLRLTGTLTLANVGLTYNHSSAGNTGLAGLTQTSFGELTHAGTATLVLDKNITLSAGIDQQTTSSLNFNDRSVIITGGSWAAVTSSSLITNTNSALTFTTGSTLTLPATITSLNGRLLVSGTGTVLDIAAASISLPSIKIRHSGSVDFSGVSVTFNDTLQNQGTILTNSATDFTVTGPQRLFTGTTGITVIDDITIDRIYSFFVVGPTLNIHGQFQIINGGIDLEAANGHIIFEPGSSFSIPVAASYSYASASRVTVRTGGTFNWPTYLTAFSGTINVEGNSIFKIDANLNLGGSGLGGLNVTSGSQIDFSDRVLVINGAISLQGTNSMATTSNSELFIGSTLTTPFTIPSSLTLRTLQLSRPAICTVSGSLNVNTTLTVNTGATLVAQAAFTSTGNVTINGTVDITGLSSVNIAGSGTITGSFKRILSSACSLDRPGQTIRVTDSLSVSNSLNLTTGTTLNTSDAATRLATTSNTISGSWTFNNNSSLHLLGTGTISNLPTFTQITNLTLSRSGHTHTVNGSLAISGVFTLSAGTLSFANSSALTLSGPINFNGGTFQTLPSSNVIINGSGTINNFVNLGTISSFTFNRAGATLGIGSLTTSTFTHANGTIDFSNGTISVSGTANIASNAPYVSNNTSNLSFSGSALLSNFPRVSTLGSLNLSRNTTIVLPLDLVVNSAFTLSTGTLNISDRSLTLASTVTIDPAASIVTNSGTSIHLIGSGSFSGSISMTSLNNLTLTKSGLVFDVPSNLTVSGTFNSTRTLNMNGNLLTLSGPITSFGSFSNNSPSLLINGSGTINNATRLNMTSCNNLTMNRSGQSLKISDVNVNGTFTMSSGTLNLIDDAGLSESIITFSGPIDITAGSIVSDTLSAISIIGAGTITSLPPITTLGRFRYDRAGTTFVQPSDLVVYYLFELLTGTYNFSNRTLTIGGDYRIVAANSSMIGNSATSLVFNQSPGFTLGSITGDGFEINDIGNLTINRPGLIWPFTSSALTINGSLSIPNGTLDATDKQLTLSGGVNITDTLLLVNTDLTINGSGSVTGLTLRGTLQSLDLSRNAIYTQTGGLTINGSCTMSAGQYQFHGQSFTLNGTVNISNTAFLTSSGSSLHIGGSGSITGLPSFSILNNFTLNRAGYTYRTSSFLSLSGTYTLIAGTHDIRGRSISLSGPINISGGVIDGSATTSIGIDGSGTLIGAIPLDTVNNLQITRAGFSFVQGQNLVVMGALNVASAVMNLNGFDLKLLGALNSTPDLTLLGTSTSSLEIAGSGSFTTNLSFNQLEDFTLNRTGTNITLASTGTIGGAFNVQAGTFNIGTGSLTLSGSISLLGGSFSAGSTSSLVIDGTGSISGQFTFSQLSNFTLDRAGATAQFAFGLQTFTSYKLLNGTQQFINNSTLAVSGSSAQFGNGILAGNGSNVPSLTISATTVTGGLNATKLGTLTISSSNLTFKLNTSMELAALAVNQSDSRIDISGISLTVTGSCISSSAGIKHTPSSSFHLIGSGVTSNLAVFDTLTNLTIGRNFTYFLQKNTTVTGTLTNSGTVVFTLAGYRLELNGPVIGAATISTSNSSSRLIVGGAGSFDPLTFIGTSIGTISCSRSTGNLRLRPSGGSMGISSLLNISAGTFDFAGVSLNLNGASVNTLGASIVTNGSSSISSLSSATNGTLHLGSDSIGTINTTNASTNFTIKLLAPLVVRNNITITTNNILDFRGQSLTCLSGVFTSFGQLLYDGSSSLKILGTTGSVTLPEFTQPLNNFTFMRTGNILNRADLKITGLFTVGTGARLVISDTLQLSGNWSIQGAVEFSSINTADLIIDGTGTSTSGAPRTILNRSIQTFTLNRPGFTFNVNTALAVQNNFNLIAGRLNVGDGRLEVIANGTVPADSITYGANSTIYVGANTGETLTGFPIKGVVDTLAFYHNTADGAMIPMTGDLVANVVQLEGMFKLNGHKLVVNNRLHSVSFTNVFFNTDAAAALELNLNQALTDNVRFLTYPSSFVGDLAKFKYNYTTNFSLSDHLTIHDTLDLPQGNLLTGSRVLTLGPSAIILNEQRLNQIFGTIRSTRTLGTAGNSFGNMGFVIGSGSEDIGQVTLTRRNSGMSMFTVGSNNSINCHYSVSISGAQPTSGRPISFSWFTTEDNGNNFSSNTGNVWRRNTSSDPFVLIATGASITTVDDRRTINFTTNHFSDFAVEDGNNPLPVDFGAISADRAIKEVRLTWTTLTEERNRGFIVERSFDGQSFDQIGFVKGVGFSTAPLRYSYQDINQPEMAYYRLRQQDHDLTEKLSPVVSVEAMNATKPVVYLNNQADLSFYSSDPMIKLAEVALFDATGKQVYSASISKGEVLSLRSLPAGVYNYRILTGSQSSSGKVIRQ